MDPVLTKLIEEDSLFPGHIKSFGTIPTASECKAILLTGVTGNLGPYLLARLLERSQLTIYCLVRENSMHLAESVLSGFEINNDCSKRVILVPGDLSLEKLGIELSHYDDLCLEIDAVIHSGVKSHHLEMYRKNIGKSNDLRSVNVLGTLRILEFATARKVKRVFYASSILACNRISTTENTLSEELIQDDNYGDGLGMGYAVSKFICDKLMSQAIRRGIPVFVFRFPLIFFENLTETKDLRNNHYFCLLMACIEIGMKPEYPSACPAVPADICAKLSIDLFFNDGVPEGIYNVMNPHDWDIESFGKKMEKVFGLPKWKNVAYQEFSNALIVQGANSVLSPFKIIYCDKDAEEILTQFNMITKLLLTKEGSIVLERVSSKFRKFVPDVNALVETTQEILFKMILLGRDAGYFPEKFQKLTYERKHHCCSTN